MIKCPLLSGLQDVVQKQEVGLTQTNLIGYRLKRFAEDFLQKHSQSPPQKRR